MLMSDEDREKNAFLCHRGMLEFNVMPFGICNAPQVFSEIMSIALKGLDSFALAYLEDILIFSRTIADHKKHTQIVFQRLREHGLKCKLKGKKRSFIEEQTHYLGFVIGRD